MTAGRAGAVRPRAGAGARVALAGAAAGLRRHWPIGAVLAAGAALRVVVMLAYVPFFWFTDTRRYLEFAALGRPDGVRPWGYSGFLRLALEVLDERGVVALQHALMLVLAGALYAFLVHRRVAPWLAALGVAPLVLSPLVVNIEHHLLADWLFLALVMAAVLLAAWPDGRPAVWACALAGLSLAAAAITRQVALVIVVPLVAYLLLRRCDWRRIGAFLVVLALPMAGYLAWVHATYGAYTFSTWSGKMLYARVAQIAECDRLGSLTRGQRALCDPRPPSARPGPEFYLWKGGKRAAHRLPDAMVGSFARKVILHQPVPYARMVAAESVHIFVAGQRQRPRDACVAYWAYPDPLPGGCRTDAVGKGIWRTHPFTARQPLAHDLSVYQHLNDPVGPAMLACLLVIVAALCRRPGADGRRLSLDAAFLALLGLSLTVVAIATATFSYRYTLPLYSTLPAAAALAVTRLRAAARTPKPARERPT